MKALDMVLKCAGLCPPPPTSTPGGCTQLGHLSRGRLLGLGGRYSLITYAYYGHGEPFLEAPLTWWVAQIFWLGKRAPSVPSLTSHSLGAFRGWSRGQNLPPPWLLWPSFQTDTR